MLSMLSTGKKTEINSALSAMTPMLPASQDALESSVADMPSGDSNDDDDEGDDEGLK